MTTPLGKLITFEGGEGAGKSTQVRLLVDRLNGAGVHTIATREPGGAPHAEELREILLSGFAAPLGPVGEAVLFTAARIDHMEATILPALEAGTFVVCDRFIDSMLAYQGAVGQVDGRIIAMLERVAVGVRRPDLTVLIDTPPEVGLIRAAQRRGRTGADRFEAENLAFHTQLREAFRAIADHEPKRFLVIDGLQPAAEIGAAIWAEAQSRFSIAARTPA